MAAANSPASKGCLSATHHLTVGPEAWLGRGEVGKACVEDEIVLDDARFLSGSIANSPQAPRRMISAALPRDAPLPGLRKAAAIARLVRPAGGGRARRSGARPSPYWLPPIRTPCR